MTPLVNPSLTFHAVCAYWLTSNPALCPLAPGHTTPIIATVATLVTNARVLQLIVLFAPNLTLKPPPRVRLKRSITHGCHPERTVGKRGICFFFPRISSFFPL